ncbi:MAG: hypothetical protein RIG62_07090 [Cyclobacteriaceae bacterium]
MAKASDSDRAMGLPLLSDVAMPLTGHYGLRAVGANAFLCETVN